MSSAKGHPAMQPDVEVSATRARVLASLRRTRAILARVLASNRYLREFPGHEASAEERIVEGEEEIAAVDAQIEAIESQHADRPPRP